MHLYKCEEEVLETPCIHGLGTPWCGPLPSPAPVGGPTACQDPLLCPSAAVVLAWPYGKFLFNFFTILANNILQTMLSFLMVLRMPF